METVFEKHVSFSTIAIREYSTMLGDHPCCSIGCPLTLGWEFQQIPAVSVDAYEASRPARKGCLRTSSEERHNRLVESSASEADMRKVQRQLHRSRSQRELRRSCVRFFSE